jgi:hypothetical protein
MIKEIHNHSKGIRSGIGSRCGSTKILNPEGLSWKRLMQECIEALKGAENLIKIISANYFSSELKKSEIQLTDTQAMIESSNHRI